MRKKNLKLMICAGFLSIPFLSYSDSSYKLNKCSSNYNVSIADENNNVLGNVDSIDFLTTTNTTTQTTTATTVTTTTTTTEPIDQYKHLRIFEKLNNNDLSVENLDVFIKRYADFTKMSYDAAIDILNDNILSIENDYESIRGGIMCTLFSVANENGVLKVYTDDRDIREDMSQQEKENLIIEFCNNLKLCDDDICIVLSAFREETGCGTSSRCVYDNNFGGIRIYGEEGCNGEYGRYSTPEFGVYRQVKCVSNKLKNIRSENVNDLETVVYKFACRYNPDYADTYSTKILGWIYDVQSDYDTFKIEDIEKKYTK